MRKLLCLLLSYFSLEQSSKVVKIFIFHIWSHSLFLLIFTVKRLGIDSEYIGFCCHIMQEWESNRCKSTFSLNLSNQRLASLTVQTAKVSAYTSRVCYKFLMTTNLTQNLFYLTMLSNCRYKWQNLPTCYVKIDDINQAFCYAQFGGRICSISIASLLSDSDQPPVEYKLNTDAVVNWVHDTILFIS